MSKGIDVSVWNGPNIDWQAVKADGIDFAIIRAGYGSRIEQKDVCFDVNFAGAKEAGLKVGVYWYSYGDCEQDAINEANTCLEIIKGLDIDLPVYFDIEEKSQLERGKEFCSMMVKTFCNVIENAGYEAGVYISRYYLQTVMDNEVKDFDHIWVAEYSDKLNYDGKYEIWQYASDGTVNGIAGRVDMNIKEGEEMGLTKTVDGVTYEMLRFPMKVLSISQGAYGTYSHLGYPALDLCGKDSGVDPTFAPCEMELVYYNKNDGNRVIFQSVKPVYWADGTIDYATMCFMHDNYIDDIIAHAQSIGTWKQWEEFGDEGVSGQATGNHCHLELAKGKYTSPYLYNSYGFWQLPNAVNPDLGFVIDDVELVNNGQPQNSGAQMHWKTSSDIDDVKGEDYSVKINGLECIPELGSATFNKNVNIRIDSPTGDVMGQVHDGDEVDYFAKYVGNGHRYIVTTRNRRLVFISVSGSEDYNVDKWTSEISTRLK